jgi:hypothetical protein
MQLLTQRLPTYEVRRVQRAIFRLGFVGVGFVHFQSLVSLVLIDLRSLTQSLNRVLCGMTSGDG